MIFSPGINYEKSIFSLKKQNVSAKLAEKGWKSL